MSNKVTDIDIKKPTYNFFDDIINIKKVDPNKIELDEKSFKNILIYDIGYVTIKVLKYVKINSVNNLLLIFSKVKEYFEEISKSKHLTLVPTNDRKEKKKIKNEELGSKIKDLIRSIIKRLDGYDEKYMKIKFNSDDELPPNEKIETPTTIRIFENNKYYPEIF